MKRIFALCMMLIMLICSPVFAEDQIGGVKAEDVAKNGFDMSIIKQLQAEGKLQLKDTLQYGGLSKKTWTHTEVLPETWAVIADMANFVEAQSQGKYIVYVSCLWGEHEGNLKSDHWDGTAVDFAVCRKDSPGYDAEVCNEQGYYASYYDAEFHKAMVLKLQGCGCSQPIDHYTGMYLNTTPPSYDPDMHARDSGGHGPIGNGHFHVTSIGYTGGVASFDWLKGIYDIGKDLTDFMDEIITYIGKAVKFLSDKAIYLFFIMAIIDLALTTMLAGFEITPFTLAIKMIKYGFFLFLIQEWPLIANEFFVELPMSVANTMGNGVMELTQPHLVLQKGLSILSPGINYISSTFISPASLVPLIIICVAAFSAMIALFIFTIYIIITYVEFYIAIALNIIFIPFGVFGFTKFTSAGSMNYVWKCTVKMMVLAMITGIIGLMFQQVDMKAITEAMGAADHPIIRVAKEATGYGIFQSMLLYIKMAFFVCVMSLFGWFSTSKIASALSGRFDW